ncbi:hypothetical protein Pcinc_012391 [Petrolisthes cinctipes]|uniref:Uncharacterized protein n=1 Tax=Petrolisthes cinctipes TaxID=88211 RepID=A0AAE1KRL1_PETCI|nr:hypothetical protein Pcinc_012391 [Petrolisthes cinctipes]
MHAPPPVTASSRKGRGKKGSGRGKKLVRMEPPSQDEEEEATDDPDFFDEDEDEDINPLSRVIGKRRQRARSQMFASQEVDAAAWYAENEIF